MKTVAITLYNFDELSSEAQAKVIGQFQPDYGWWEGVYEDAKSSGLNITGFELEAKNIGIEFLTSALDCANTIIAEHGEICGTYRSAANYLADRAEIEADDLDDSDVEIAECDSDFLDDISVDYFTLLTKDYENQCSEEYIKETIAVNDYEFLANGEIFNQNKYN